MLTYRLYTVFMTSDAKLNRDEATDPIFFIDLHDAERLAMQLGSPVETVQLSIYESFEEYAPPKPPPGRFH
jgi:hypothetical protein